jgi:hypothetical protein
LGKKRKILFPITTRRFFFESRIFSIINTCPLVSMCGQSHPNREGVKMLFFSSGKSTTGHVLGAWSPVWRCVVEHQRKLSFSLFLSYASSRVNSFAPPCVPYPDMFPYYDPHPQKMGPNNHRLNPPKLLAK